MISVIIPSYNRSAVVGRAIVSALRQTYCDLEIIVVDDASDDFEDVVKAVNILDDCRVRIVRHKRNLGGAAARNTGVANANGQYIAFLDSDDEWLPSKLEKQLVLARTQLDGRWLSFTQSKVLTTQNTGSSESIMPLRPISCAERVGDYLFVGRGWLPTPAMLLPKELAIEVPFNPTLKRHQDYDFLLRLEEAGCRFLMVNEPLVIVHWEDFHQTSRGLEPKNSLEFLRNYQRFLSKRARSGFVMSQIVMRLLGAGRRYEAVMYFLLHVKPWHLTPVQFVSFLSATVFRDARLARMLAVAKHRLFATSDKKAENT